MRVAALQTMRTLKIIETLNFNSLLRLTASREDSVVDSFETM